LPDPALVLLIGPSGAGKSTFAAAHFMPTEVVSSDALRGMLTDDEADQAASSDAFRLLGLIVNGRLKRGRTTVVDATNLYAPGRNGYRRAASRHGIPTIAICFDLSLSSYHARNAARPDRLVADEVVADQAARMSAELERLDNEGYAAIYILTEADLLAGVTVERR
jgi:protein phosphatase